MPSSAQTGGSTESNASVLKHEKEELIDISSPQQDMNDVDFFWCWFFLDFSVHSYKGPAIILSLEAGLPVPEALQDKQPHHQPKPTMTQPKTWKDW